jgi:hypothetical protein
MWMCKTNLICLNGRLDLAPASETPGIPMSIRFGVESLGEGEYKFVSAEMTAALDADRIDLNGDVMAKAIKILMNREDLWEEFCLLAEYKRIGAF